jgi:hypothetical protein
LDVQVKDSRESVHFFRNTEPWTCINREVEHLPLVLSMHSIGNDRISGSTDIWI